MEIKYLKFVEDFSDILGNHIGLTEAEITNIEYDLSIKFPQSYKEFLFFFGKKSGNVLTSYYVTYPVMLEIKKDVIDLFADIEDSQAEIFLLSKDFFFFATWQGYIFYYFDCSKNEDDPAVFTLDDSLEVDKYFDSFSQFVLEEGIKMWSSDIV